MKLGRDCNLDKVNGQRVVPVIWRGECCHDDVSSVDVDDVSDGLQDVKVEMRVSGDGAVQSRL